jgi:hypothetical protein
MGSALIVDIGLSRAVLYAAFSREILKTVAEFLKDISGFSPTLPERIMSVSAIFQPGYAFA